MVELLKNNKKLNIGCGEKQKQGYISVDFRKTVFVDVVADARKLPFKNESFHHVYSSHLIEHFSHMEVEDVLKEGDEIEVKVLDIDNNGKIKLSRKVLLPRPPQQDDDRNPRRQ